MKTYRFGDYLLDADNRKLFRRSGEIVPLTPRVFDLLLALVENCGRVLTKDELLETVWKDCIVEESNLSQSIFVLRKALGETAQGSRLIRTIPAQGYHFVGAVTVEESDKTEKVGANNGTVAEIAEEILNPLEDKGGGKDSILSFWQNPAVFTRSVLVILCLMSILAALYGFSNFFSSETGEESAKLQMVQLFTPETKPEGEILDVNFSPDGKIILFSSVNDGVKKIYSRLASGGELVEITDGNFESYSPIWSPDGLRITFLSKHDGKTEIRTTSYLGGQSFLQALLSEPEASTAQLKKWSVDGEHIFFETAGKLKTIRPEFGVIEDAAESEFVNETNFNVSPDEKTVVFTTIENGKEQLWIQTLAGGQARKLTDNNYRNLSPSWFPNSRRIAFISNRTGDFQIYTIGISGKNLTQIIFNNYNCYYPVVAPDGLKVFFKLATNFDNN